MRKGDNSDIVSGAWPFSVRGRCTTRQPPLTRAQLSPLRTPVLPLNAAVRRRDDARGGVTKRDERTATRDYARASGSAFSNASLRCPAPERSSGYSPEKQASQCVDREPWIASYTPPSDK